MTSIAQHEALAQAYEGITAVVAGRNDADLQRPTRCRGWLVADLLFHVLCDAQRALVALASPADGPPDVDDVSYWRTFPPGGDGDDAARHAWWVRRSAAAFDRPAECSGSGPTPPPLPCAPPPPPTRPAASAPRGTCCGYPTFWPR